MPRPQPFSTSTRTSFKIQGRLGAHCLHSGPKDTSLAHLLLFLTEHHRSEANAQGSVTLLCLPYQCTEAAQQQPCPPIDAYEHDVLFAKPSKHQHVPSPWTASFWDAAKCHQLQAQFGNLPQALLLTLKPKRRRLLSMHGSCLMDLQGARRATSSCNCSCWSQHPNTLQMSRGAL